MAELLGMIGVNVDITERKDAEQLRREMVDADRYRILVEAITDYAVYLLDPNGKVSSWNPGAQRFKGYSSSEIIGQNFSVFYTPEDQAANLPKKHSRSPPRKESLKLKAGGFARTEAGFGPTR